MKKLVQSDSLKFISQIEINSLQKYQIQSKVKTSKSQQRNEGPAQCDYGSLNRYKLEDLINIQADGFSESKVVRLAYIENHSIHLQEQAIQIFEKYAKNELVFMAMYGKSQSGKSLLLDKLINLTEVQGSHFTHVQEQLKGIYLWSIPFSRNNTKIFLVDINGYDTASLDQDYLVLLSFLLFITSSLVLLSSPIDFSFQELSTLYKHLKKCKKYFVCQDPSQIEAIWPENLYCLFRSSVSGSKTIDSLRSIFKTFNFKVVSNAMQEKYSKQFKDSDLKNVSMKKYNEKKKMLSEDYIRHISGLFRHVYEKINFKSIMNFRFTGANLVKLVINAVQSLNVKGHLAINKICHRSMKELYCDAYSFHTQLYNEHLSTYLNDQKPFEVDYLINAFKDTHHFIFKSFNQLTTSPELKKTYSQKLQKYINEKQKMILAINKKKSANQAKDAIPKAKPQPNQINEFIKEAKASPKYLQQVYPEEIVPYIATAIKEIQVKKKKIEQKQGITKKHQVIVSKIQQKQSELKQLKSNKLRQSKSIKENIIRKQSLDSKQKQLNQAMKRLKQSLQQIRASESVNQGQKLKVSAEQLRIQQQKLKKEIKAKQKTIQQLRLQPEVMRSNQHISLLASQIQQKVIKQKQLQSALASHIPKLQSIQTFKSGQKITSPRKVQSRTYRSQNPHIRVISSNKN